MPTFPDMRLPFPGGVLRAWHEADLPAVVDAANDPQVQQWLPLPSPYAMEHARGFCLVQAPALRAATGNEGSRAVARRAGFVEEGTARNAGFVHGGRVDLVISSLVPADLERPA